MSLLPEHDRESCYDFVTTCSGAMLNLHDPKPEDITADDIATGLANNCRFSGQLPVHYSVAAHSIVMADLMDSEEAQLYALLHDASEAYITDMPRPVKALCPDYRKIEGRIQQAVIDKFYHGSGVSEKVAKHVHQMDKVMPAFEKVAIHGPHKAPPWAWDTLHEAYKGSSLDEELHRVVPMIREMMLSRPFIKRRYLEYLKELTDVE